MAKRTKEPEIEAPILPPFPSENWSVTVAIVDAPSETIKVYARGKAAAIITAMYTVGGWPSEKIENIVSVTPCRG